MANRKQNTNGYGGLGQQGFTSVTRHSLKKTRGLCVEFARVSEPESPSVDCVVPFSPAQFRYLENFPIIVHFTIWAGFGSQGISPWNLCIQSDSL